MFIHEIHVFELHIGTNLCMIPRSSSSNEKGLNFSGLSHYYLSCATNCEESYYAHKFVCWLCYNNCCKKPNFLAREKEKNVQNDAAHLAFKWTILQLVRGGRINFNLAPTQQISDSKCNKPFFHQVWSTGLDTQQHDIQDQMSWVSPPLNLPSWLLIFLSLSKSQ